LKQFVAFLNGVYRRSGIRDTYDAHIRVVLPQLDLAVRETFESSNISLKLFIKTRADALAVLWGRENVDEAIKAAGVYTDIPRTIAKIMMTSETGSCMFRSTWLACSREIFKQTAKEQLENLERHDFAVDANTNYDKFMTQLSANLRSDGHRRGKTEWRDHVTLGTETVPTTTDYAGDEHEFRYWARIKTIVINTGQKQPFPWERLFWAKGGIPNVPEVLEIPDEILEPMDSLREHIIEKLEGKTDTLASITKHMQKIYDECKELHMSVQIDMAFLEHIAEPFLRRLAFIEDPLDYKSYESTLKKDV